MLQLHHSRRCLGSQANRSKECKPPQTSTEPRPRARESICQKGSRFGRPMQCRTKSVVFWNFPRAKRRGVESRPRCRWCVAGVGEVSVRCRVESALTQRELRGCSLKKLHHPPVSPQFNQTKRQTTRAADLSVVPCLFLQWLSVVSVVLCGLCGLCGLCPSLPLSVTLALRREVRA